MMAPLPGLQPSDYAAIGLSLRVACAATVISAPFGFAVAYLLSFSRMPGKVLLEAVVNLPLVLPPVVVGYLLLLTFGQNGVIGELLARWDIRIIFTLKGAVIASATVGFPLLVRAIRIGMDGMDNAAVLAARTLGACWWDALFTITLPLTARAIISGMTLMFARSLGEFGATIILAGNIPAVTQTIPLAIYEYTATPGGDRMALSLCLISIILSLGVLLISEVVNRSLVRE